MRVIQVSETQAIQWQRFPELACLCCHEPLGTDSLYVNTLDSANMLWPDWQAVKDGDYCYLHKRCSNIPFLHLWTDVYLLLGLKIRQWHFYRNAWKEWKRDFPQGLWEQVRADWSTHLLPKRIAVPSVQQVAVQPSAVLRPAQSGSVYVLHAEGTTRIKIGRARSLPIRLETLRTASPYPLTLLRAIQTNDTAQLEQRLHRRYAAYRRHGEWFELPATVLTQLLEEEFV